MLVPAEAVTGTNGRGRMCVFLAVDDAAGRRSRRSGCGQLNARTHTVHRRRLVDRKLVFCVRCHGVLLVQYGWSMYTSYGLAFYAFMSRTCFSNKKTIGYPSHARKIANLTATDSSRRMTHPTAQEKS